MDKINIMCSQAAGTWGFICGESTNRPKIQQLQAYGRLQGEFKSIRKLLSSNTNMVSKSSVMNQIKSNSKQPLQAQEGKLAFLDAGKCKFSFLGFLNARSNGFFI